MNDKQANWLKLTRSYTVWDDNNIKGFFGEMRWLSNFEKCKKGVMLYDGTPFETTENAYQFSKHYLFDHPPKQVKEWTDQEYNTWTHDKAALYLMSPAEAKAWGQKMKLRNGWEDLKYDIMMQLVFDKFWRNDDLKVKLLNTGNKYLEETNHWRDEFYGINFKTGAGQNNLGKILMKVRECLKRD